MQVLPPSNWLRRNLGLQPKRSLDLTDGATVFERLLLARYAYIYHAYAMHLPRI